MLDRPIERTNTSVTNERDQKYVVASEAGPKLPFSHVASFSHESINARIEDEKELGDTIHPHVDFQIPTKPANPVS